MRSSCILMPEVNGEISKLYKDLSAHVADRPLVNLIYASYMLPGVADAMDAAGYKRYKQGQHDYRDVYDFLKIKEFRKEQSNTIENDGRVLGTIDSEYKYVDFSNPEDACQLAADYNSNHEGRVAYVIQQGDVFNVIIQDKDSYTINHLYNFNKQVSIWDEFKTSLRSGGVDVDEFLNIAGYSMVNPTSIESFLQTYSVLQNATNNDILTLKDIKIFLTLGKSLPKVQQLFTRWGNNIDDVAQKCFDAIQNPSSVASSTLNFINNALNDAKTTSPTTMQKIKQNIKSLIVNSFNPTNEEKQIIDVLDDLEQKYHISADEVVLKGKEIKTLSEALRHSIITLERQIRNIESEHGITSTVKKLEKTKDILSTELSSKKYCYGISKFLEQALVYSNDIHNILQNIPVGGSKQDEIKNKADAVNKATALRDAYYHIVESLANMDNLIIDENINTTDKTDIQNKAKEVKEILDKQKCIIDNFRREVAILNMELELGENPVNGIAYAQTISLMEHDTSIIDYVGRISDSSNMILASVGSLVRNHELQRDEELRQIEHEIEVVTKELYKAGYTSAFMYDKNGRIITEEDVKWEDYESNRTVFIDSLKRRGYTGLFLKEAIELWEEQNTIEKEVDPTTGRKERIPDSRYWETNPDKKVFSKLTPEQKAYYYKVMEIKGRLGSYLPKYAQKQFVAPQLRKNWFDFISDVVSGKISLKKAVTNILQEINPIKIHKDDEDFITVSTYSDFDNTSLKKIPIFYLNSLGDEDTLLRDFSSALQSFAATAINYKAMSIIQETVESIQDLVGELNTVEYKGSNPVVDTISYYDAVKQRVNNVCVRLRKKAKESRTSTILNAYVEQVLYNEKYKGNPRLNKIVNSLLGYNAFVRLSANVLGAQANLQNGILQTIIQAGGYKYYNLADLVAATGVLLGTQGVGAVGKVWDILSNNKSSFDTLLCDFFDVHKDNYSSKSRRRYHKNAFRRLFGKFDSQFLYQTGEFIIRSLNFYAMLIHKKVYIGTGSDRKKRSLLFAFKKSDDKNHPTLQLVDNVTDLDGNDITLDGDFLRAFKKEVEAVGDECFGAMSQEDKGIINQYCLGRMAMSFRQWMVEVYSARYRGKHYSFGKKKMVEGWWHCVGRLLWEFAKGIGDLKTTYTVMKDHFSKEDGENILKAVSEFTVFLVLSGLTKIFEAKDEEDDEKEFWERVWLYGLKRSRSEILATLPLGIFSEFKRTIDSLIPVSTTINNLLYPIEGLFEGDATETISGGRYADWNKYVRNVLWYTVPFYKQIDQLIHITEEEALFTIFDRKQ